MIEGWEAKDQGRIGLHYEAPYALERVHKHVPEMTRYSGLAHDPAIRARRRSLRLRNAGRVPLHAESAAGRDPGEAVWQLLADRYRGERFVEVAPFTSLDADRRFRPRPVRPERHEPDAAPRLPESGRPPPAGRHPRQPGQGRLGAAIQSLNLMLGLDEGAGLPV